jgi:hypothetical protein
MMKTAIYIAIIMLGLLQSIGYVLGSKAIRGLGAASGSSPLPLVFTEVKGVETFASDFFVTYTDAAGKDTAVQITPKNYAKLQGPYNRRNIYGAAIAYGPILKKDLLDAVLNYGLCTNRSLLKEMGLPLDATNYAIKIKTRTANRHDEWILKPNCKY